MKTGNQNNKNATEIIMILVAIFLCAVHALKITQKEK